MKSVKSLIFVILCCLSATTAWSHDETKHEIGVSYGFVSNSNIINIFTDCFSAILGVNTKSSSYLGPIGVDYFYNVNHLIGIGAVGCHTFRGFAEVGWGEQGLILVGARYKF